MRLLTDNTATATTLAFRNFRAARASFERAAVLKRWDRGEQLQVDPTESPTNADWTGRPFQPKNTGTEYKDLISRSPGAWGGLVVRSMAQTAYVQGIRRSGITENLPVWQYWKRNGMDAKQISLHRGALAQGQSFAVVEPGADPLTGQKMPRVSLYSAERMAAFYSEERDDWPAFAIWAQKRLPSPRTDERGGWDVVLIDEKGYHYLSCVADGERQEEWTFIETRAHPFAVPPVVRFVGELDLEGNATGVIEPVIPILRRIDQDTFDRLIVQRYGAWKVRWISGMATPDAEDELELRVQDLLTSPSKDTKFGTLEETQIDGFLKSGQNDLRELSALAQIPPHHLLGLSDNLQAEALAAAEAGLQRRSLDFRITNGESYERLFRLMAIMDPTMVSDAQAYDLEIDWRDTESRSFLQAVQGLGIAASQLGVPLEMLWKKMPNWTEADQANALQAVESGAADALIEQIKLVMQSRTTLGGGAGGGTTPSPMDQGEARRDAASQ